MTERTPLVLIPGLLCNERLWDHQSRHLADIAEVSVGNTLEDDTISGMARRILENAPASFALAGLSMGGYVAQEIMRLAPERVRRLALVDTSARADTAEALKRRAGLIDLATKGKFKGVTPRLLPLLIHPDRLEDQGLTSAIMGMAERIGQEVFVQQQNTIMSRVDGRGDLGRIAVPTAIICGREDALTPMEVQEELASGIPGARLCVIEECGHLSPMERPHAVTALMRDWLLRL